MNEEIISQSIVIELHEQMEGRVKILALKSTEPIPNEAILGTLIAFLSQYIRGDLRAEVNQILDALESPQKLEVN